MKIQLNWPVVKSLLYTHDIKKYFLRLGVFALISQPCYVLAFHPRDFLAQLTNGDVRVEGA